MYPFKYMDGTLAEEQDRVLIDGARSGIVVRVLRPLTEAASNHGCHDSGGVLIEFDDGDVQLWPDLDEDIEKVQQSL